MHIYILDYSYSSTIPVKGESLSVGEFGRWYRDQLVELCAKVSFSGQFGWFSIPNYGLIQDQEVADIAWRANMFLAPGTDTLLPSVVFKVALQWISRRASEELAAAKLYIHKNMGQDAY